MAPSILKEGMKQDGLAVKPSLVSDKQMAQMLEELIILLSLKSYFILILFSYSAGMAPSILKEGMKQDGLAVKPSLIPDERMAQMLEQINLF